MRLNVGTVFNTPPPTQGLASLIILALYQRLRVSEAESFEFAHGLVEATKRAFRVRDRVVTDPARLPQSPDRFLDPKFLDAEATKIDRRKAARWPAPPGEGDTIWMGAADASGLAVSYIQSLYWEFGSGCVLPSTGVLMQNRGSSFSLDPKALNALAPGRLPFHTLNPALAVLNDGRVMAYGTMGGDGQPQTQAMLFARHVLASPAARQGDRRAALAVGPHLGLDRDQPADGISLRRQPGGSPALRRPRRRGAVRGLLRHHGPRRRGGAAPEWHARRRARSARRRRRSRGLTPGPGAALPCGLHSAAVHAKVFVLTGLIMIRSIVAALALLLCACGPALAHPHVWVTMKSTVVYAPDGTVIGVRHAWTFDDMFSAFATQGLETKQKGVFSREELQPLAKVNVDSLKEYDYFTYAKANGKKVTFVDPADYYLDFDSKEAVLTLHFSAAAQDAGKGADARSRSLRSDLFRRFRIGREGPGGAGRGSRRMPVEPSQAAGNDQGNGAAAGGDTAGPANSGQQLRGAILQQDIGEMSLTKVAGERTVIALMLHRGRGVVAAGGRGSRCSLGAGRAVRRASAARRRRCRQAVCSAGCSPSRPSSTARCRA